MTDSIGSLKWYGAVAIVAYAPCAFGYVGPGAGLGMVAALFAIVLAVVATVVGLVLWPIRKLIQRRRAARRPPEDPPPAL